MNRKLIGLIVAVSVLAGAATVWAQTNLTVMRHADNTLWSMTCEGTGVCSSWTKLPIGKFSVQPSLTWDPSIGQYILIGIGNDQTSIWRSTFNAAGTWNNDWTKITGASPSPVAVAANVSLPNELEAFATGSVTSYGPQDCESNNEVCTIETQGTVEGNIVHNGTYTNTGTILWPNSIPNGSGGKCAPASDTVTITTPNGSTLTVQRTGMLCEVGASGSGKYTFNATYFITGGTNDFAGAKGMGIMPCSVDAGNVLGFAHGIIKK